jgi:hypothetical protein
LEHKDDPNGHRITIQSCKKDGNVTEEKYMGEIFVKKSINGVKVIISKVGRIGEEFRWGKCISTPLRLLESAQ